MLIFSQDGLHIDYCKATPLTELFVKKLNVLKRFNFIFPTIISALYQSNTFIFNVLKQLLRYFLADGFKNYF